MEHLETIVGAALRVGFGHVELHEEWRVWHGLRVSGWVLELARQDPPSDGCYFVLEAALEEHGAAYVDEIVEVVTSWARAGRGADPAAKTERPPQISDLAFLVRYLVVGGTNPSDVATRLLPHFDAEDVAAAFREAFEDPDPAASDARPEGA